MLLFGRQTRKHGKFRPKVRPPIWEKAQQLYQEEQAETMGTDYKGITAIHKELREAGYFHTAKLITLRNLHRQNKNPHSQEKRNTFLKCAIKRKKKLIRGFPSQPLYAFSAHVR